MIKSYNVGQTKERFEDLVDDVQHDNSIVITRDSDNEPVAVMVSYAEFEHLVEVVRW